MLAGCLLEGVSEARLAEVYGLPASEEELERVADAVHHRAMVRWELLQED